MNTSQTDLTLLALARKRRGWTQAYLAEKVDVSIDAVRRWESGRLPYPVSIQKLCDLFAMSPKELGLFKDQDAPLLAGTWASNDEEKKAAWELHIELVTRIPIAVLEDDRGLLREALSSIHSLFPTTRTLLRNLGPLKTQANEEKNQPFSYLAITMLNTILRPLLAKWHPLLKDYEDRRPASVGTLEYERQWERHAELRREIAFMRNALISYANAFAEIAGITSIVMDTYME
jgi:transcriptional regulator with XRE-family HTH domain